MADEGSLELAPLRAKVVLDLTQFDEGMEQIVDKTDTLKDVNVPVKVEINTNSDGIEEITDGIEEANQETEQLANNLEVVNENVEQVAESTKVLTENLNEAKQVEQEMGRHDFIINYNGEQIHAMEQSVEELTNATNIYQDALTRLNSTEAEFDEALSLDFSTMEEFQDQINRNTESLQEMINESKGLKIDLTQAQEALQDNIPLWEDLTEQQQAEFKSIGELEYNLQALQARFLEVSNAIRNLGDAMEKATENQQQFNHAVKQTKVDVSEYNQEAMQFIAGAERQAEATQESTEQLHTNGTAVAENATMVEKWGNDWWTTATMAMMSIQMITSAMGELLNTGAEVELSGIGLTETFGKQGAEAIQNFTKNANDANLTLQEVLPTAQTLGLALRQYGGTKTEIAGVTTQIMNMANQLQLATGGAVSFSEGADAIKQELAGQSYALKSLGINLSNTLLNQTALNSQWHTSYNKLDSYQQAVIKVDALQGQLNKTFGTTSTYLKSQAGQYEKNIAEFKNNMAKLGEDLLPLANAILPSILKIVEKIVSVVDKIKSNKWLVNKIEWFTKLALTGGTVALALAIVGKAFLMVTKRIRSVISATKDMVSIFKGASKFSEMRTGIGKLILALKKLTVGIGKGTATIVKTIPKIGKAFIQVGKVIGSNAIKIARILKTTVVGAILKCSSSIQTIAVALGTKIINLISEGILTSKVIFMTLQGIISTTIEGVVGKLTVFATVIKSTVIPAVLEFLADIGPIGWTLLATIGIMTLVYEAWRHNWLNIKGITKNVINFLSKAWKGFLDLFTSSTKANIHQTLTVSKNFNNTLINIFKKTTSYLSKQWTSFWRLFTSSTKENINQNLTVSRTFNRGLSDVFNKTIGEISKGWAEFWRLFTSSTKSGVAENITASNTFDTLFVSSIDSCGNAVYNTWKTICGLWTQSTQSTISQNLSITSSFSSEVASIMENLLSVLSGIWNNIYSFSSSAVQDTVSTVISAFEGLYDNVVNIFDDIWNTISSIWNDITSKLGSVGGMINNATGGLFMSMPTGFASLPTVNNFSTTNITNTTSTNLSTIQTQTDPSPIQSIPTIGELHIHSPQTLDPLQTYNQMQQWSINMANGLY